ncbi:MAG TPA: hypothetical protein VGP72_05080 [Planctomycetota bacterium]
MPVQKAIPPSGNAKRWLKAGALVAAISLVCFAAVRLSTRHVRDLQPQEIREKMESSELPLERAIEQVNRLDVQDRRELMQSREAQTYFRNLQPEQRKRFIQETLDRGIRQQIERYRQLNKEQRAEFIAEIQQRQAEERERLRNLPEKERAEMRAAITQGQLEQIVERAVQAYLSVSSSEERAELAPLFENALQNLNLARTGSGK